MNPSQHSSDPFTDPQPPDGAIPTAPASHHPLAQPQPSVPSQYATPLTWNQPSYAPTTAFANPSYPTYQPSYTNAPYTFSSYAAAPYAPTYATTPGIIRPAQQLASNARETSAAVLSGMHDAMSRFARVSALIEDVLRNLHMLFDAMFGLGYSIGAFRAETQLWLSIKTGPVAYIARLFSRAMTVWRLLCLFFMSPMAGRFSPVALVLRILGLVPEDDPLEVPLADLLRRTSSNSSDRDEQQQSQDEMYVQGDGSNL